LFIKAHSPVFIAQEKGPYDKPGIMYFFWIHQREQKTRRIVSTFVFISQWECIVNI
jgi:hypothetical protein